MRFRLNRTWHPALVAFLVVAIIFGGASALILGIETNVRKKNGAALAIHKEKKNTMVFHDLAILVTYVDGTRDTLTFDHKTNGLAKITTQMEGAGKINRGSCVVVWEEIEGTKTIIERMACDVRKFKRLYHNDRSVTERVEE